MVFEERLLIVRTNAKLRPEQHPIPQAIPVMAIVGFSSVAWLDGCELGLGEVWG